MAATTMTMDCCSRNYELRTVRDCFEKNTDDSIDFLPSPLETFYNIETRIYAIGCRKEYKRNLSFDTRLTVE